MANNVTDSDWDYTPENDATHNQPCTPHDCQINTRRAQNSETIINKLPPELLSRIFLIGEAGRSIRQKVRKASYIGFQDLVTQVCSHWRNVAIGNPTLWTYIHITRTAPHRLAYLYLSRAGSTALFDIDIEMRSRYWNSISTRSDWAHDVYRQIGYIPYMLHSLNAYGARIDRWKSLSVCVNEPGTLPKFVKFLDTLAAPALRFLSFKWNIDQHSLGEEQEVNASAFCVLLDARDPHRLSETSVPNLRCVELTSVPWRFLFSQDLLIFHGLTSLSLTAAYIRYTISGLHRLLSSSPQLESLHISSGFVDRDSATEEFTERAHLPLLCSLSVHTRILAHWALHVLKMVDAPGLQSLTISAVDEGDMHAGIAEYIATGNTLDNLPNLSIYPTLRELDIYDFACPNKELLRMLVALPSVTHLSLCGNQAEVLGESPWPLPKLSFLNFPAQPHAELEGVLYRRSEAGYPVKAIGHTKFWSTNIDTNKLPGFVKVEVFPDPVVQHDSDESVSDGEGSDEEDEDYYDEDEWYDDDEEQYYSDEEEDYMADFQGDLGEESD